MPLSLPRPEQMEDGKADDAGDGSVNDADKVLTDPTS